MSAALINWPAVTATLFSLRLPAWGSVAMRTAPRALADASVGSVKPKSLAAKVFVLSSSMVSVASLPAGASLTGVTLTVRVLSPLNRAPSPTWNFRVV